MFSNSSGGANDHLWATPFQTHDLDPAQSAVLNTPRGVQSHEGAADDSNASYSVFEIPELDLSDKMNRHLRGSVDFRSPFTSWAASLQGSIDCYTEGDGIRLAILDTHAFRTHDPSVDLEIFHCPQLWRAGLTEYRYDHEYLIHGKVSGVGYHYFTMPYNEDATLGLIEGCDDLTLDEAVVQAKAIAQPTRDACATSTEPGAYIYLVAMLLGLRYRDRRLQWFVAHLPLISKLILGFEVEKNSVKMGSLRREWGRDEIIMTDPVYSLGYPEVKMAIMVLRYMAIV